MVNITNRQAMDLLYGGKELPQQPTKKISKPRKPKVEKLPCLTEAQEQVAFVHWLRAKQLDYCAIPNANNMSFTNREIAVKVMAKQKAQGLSPGFFDLIVFLPKVIVFIEMKRVKGSKVSEDQLDWLERYNKYPYAKAYICYGCSDAIEKISNLLKNDV